MDVVTEPPNELPAGPGGANEPFVKMRRPRRLTRLPTMSSRGGCARSALGSATTTVFTLSASGSTPLPATKSPTTSVAVEIAP